MFSETNYWLPLQVLGALSQLEVGSNIWEIVMDQALKILPDSSDEPLAAAMSFAFKAAIKCQRIPQAVCIYNSQLYSISSFCGLLGISISHGSIFLR